MPESAGYSGTPLAKKLGIKSGGRVGTFGAPPHFPDILADLPDGVTLTAEPDAAVELDVAVLFSTSEVYLETRFTEIAERLTSDGGLWVAWPKKSSPLATELRESHVRSIGLASGLVDNKICAIDEDWSGLRFVRRLVDR